MLKTDNLDEYQVIKVIVNYCENKSCDECNGCVIEGICDCMSVMPRSIKIKYEKNEEVNEDEK